MRVHTGDFPRTWRVTLRTLLLCVACTTGTLAGDGRTPIWEPTVITASGNYVVTRDIAAAGVVIEVQPSALDVFIDLNGFTIERTDPGPVILAQGDPASEVTQFAMVNGTVVGAEPPVDSAHRDGPSISDYQRTFHEDIYVFGRLEISRAKQATLRDVYLTDGGFRLTGSTMGMSGSARNLTVTRSHSHGFELVNGNGFQLSGLSIETAAGDGVRCDNCNGCRFSDVTGYDMTGDGVRLVGSRGNLLSQIAMYRARNGYYVDSVSQGNSFTNVIASFMLTGGHGFDNHGAETHLSYGTFHGNSGTGLRNMGSNCNIRTTISRGNAVDFDDQGFNTWQDASNCL